MHAEDTRQSEYYLAAAVYAYAFLFPTTGTDRGASLSSVDPRPRLAADLYNLGLTLGLSTPEGDRVVLAAGRQPLPFGTLTLTIDPEQFVWGGYRMSGFIPVAQFKLRGLRNRYRQSGVGAPLAAELSPLESGPAAAAALPGIFHVRTVPDARAIREWIERGSLFLAEMHTYAGIQTVRPKTRAVVVGGGFIGLETAENLVYRQFDVTLIEMLDQVLAPLDREMARLVEGYVEQHGIRLALHDGVAGFTQTANDALEVRTTSGKVYPADLVILALGVRPETALAQTAGLTIGERGGIRVDEHMRTSNPDIFAVGDAVEVQDVVTGQWTRFPWPGRRTGRAGSRPM